jgi:tight adherence protein C
MHTDVLLALIGVFVAVVTCSGAAVYLWAGTHSVERRRLDQLVGDVNPRGAVPLQAMLLDATKEPQSAVHRLLPKSPKEMGRLRKRLAVAGYTQPSAVVIYSACEVILPILFGVGALLLFRSRMGLAFAALAAIIGFFLPGLVLERRIRQRKLAISNGLADALDVLIVCIEAGHAIDQAIVKAGEELRVSHPALAEELRLINIETRAGKPRLEAFKNFAERTRVEDVRALVAMLVQTDRFGTSVAQALKTFADVLRTKRRQRAEEKAAKLGVKLVIPLAFLLFPALYVVLLGPAVVDYIREFRQHVQRK